MKKTYMAPEAEKVEFRYRNQVVAASGFSCANYTKMLVHTLSTEDYGHDAVCHGYEAHLHNSDWPNCNHPWTPGHPVP